jgi:hypothetical protein
MNMQHAGNTACKTGGKTKPSCVGSWGGGGGVAVSFRFPTSIVAGTDLNLGERWGRGFLHGR